MKFKAVAARIFAARIAKRNNKWVSKPIETQQKVFRSLIRRAANTQFGKDHGFDEIKTYEDFVERVPVRDYEALRPYVDKMVSGDPDILWPGKPLYFAKTSGTTSGAKFIPLTKSSLPTHIRAARDAILTYIHETGKFRFCIGQDDLSAGKPCAQREEWRETGQVIRHCGPLCSRLSPTQSLTQLGDQLHR